MTTVVVELPGAVLRSEPLTWLLARLRAEQPAIEVRGGEAEAIGILLEAADGSARRLLSVPVSREATGNAGNGALAIAPGLSLEPAAVDDLSTFLRGQWRGSDHVGINLSHRELDEPAWQSFVAALGAAVPAWRLDVGSVNDIVFIVLENEGAATAAVVELVYDRTAAHSSVHFCVRVAASRDAVERQFAAPHGGYKTGDEAFFRSVALPSPACLPIYVDLAFSEAQVAPWPQTVRAIGRRVG
jgi:hypothetical protein